MLTRDDVTVLEDWMKKHREWFDDLFVLDGSINERQESKQIIERYNSKYFHDSEFKFKQKTDHTLRGVLFEKIKTIIQPGYDYWIVIAHPDEFYIQPLNIVINKAYTVKTNLIVYNVLHNFPHVSEKEEYLRTRDYKTFKHFVHNYKDSKKESRIFKYNPNLYYGKQHSLVTPFNLDKKNSDKFHPAYFHYKLYNLDLFSKKGETMNSVWSSVKTHFPENHKFEKIDDFFMETPAGSYKENSLYHMDKPLPDVFKC